MIAGLREANRETRNRQDTDFHKNGNCFSDKRKENGNLGLKVNISPAACDPTVRYALLLCLFLFQTLFVILFGSCVLLLSAPTASVTAN